MSEELEQFRSAEEAEAARDFEAPESETSVEQEKRKPPFDAVIVLGSGIEDPFWKWYNEKHPDSPITKADQDNRKGWMLGVDARMRTMAAVEMYLQRLTSKIIFTGGRTAEKRGIAESEAEKMRAYADYLLRRGGVKPEEIEDAIILEDRATNTIENIANVCGIIDANPEGYEHLAILTNGYHLDRAQALIKKFNLEAQGFTAEDLLVERSPKYQRILKRFFASTGYQDRVRGEIRWTRGLQEMPQYWHPQALSVENPERIDYILKSLGLEQIAEKVGRENLIRFLRETPRNIPPEG